jgi:hypothetical protein
MALTNTQVANRALGKLGATPITSYADDVSKNARDIRAVYEIILKDELRARKWSFAIKRANLVELLTPPEYEYEHQFALPADFLRILDTDLSGNLYGSAYRIEGRAILTNETSLKLRYLAYIDNPDLWDSCFVESFACRLACEVAEAVTQSTNKRQLAWSEYEQSIKKARSAGALEHDAEYIQPDSWEMARSQ